MEAESRDERGDSSEERSDPSESDSSGSDSSIEAAINGEEDTADAIYEQI